MSSQGRSLRCLQYCSTSAMSEVPIEQRPSSHEPSAWPLTSTVTPWLTQGSVIPHCRGNKNYGGIITHCLYQMLTRCSESN
jgi:hypothetical protein